MELNDAGDRLLHGVPLYANITFGEYLTRCPAPQLPGLPAGSRLLVFREATNDACHDMLMNVLNQVSQSIVLCDGEGRMYLLNDAAVRLDAMVTRDVLGESVRTVYKMLDGTEMAIPRVIREKKPILNHRQYYATRYGREVDAVSNTFPITQNGQVLGAFNILEDWSAILPAEPRFSCVDTSPLRRVPQSGPPPGSKLRDLEYDTLCAALRHSGGNISQAARALSISRQNLQYRIKRYKIDLGALDKA